MYAREFGLFHEGNMEPLKNFRWQRKPRFIYIFERSYWLLENGLGTGMTGGKENTQTIYNAEVTRTHFYALLTSESANSWSSRP